MRARHPQPPHRRTGQPRIDLKPLWAGLIALLCAASSLQAQVPATQPTTQAATQAATQPATQAATQAATQSATQPTTQSATQAATQPSATTATICPQQWPAVSATARPERQTLAEQENTRQQLFALRAHETACDANPGFHAHRGLLLMQAGWLQEAATALEKSLLLAPDQPGVQLDYAQALGQLGQRASARQLVATVAARPDIAPNLRQWLETGLLPEAARWQWSTLVQTSLGYDSNQTSATYTDTLTLFLPGGPVQVSLADSERPRSGYGLKTRLATQGMHPVGPGVLRLGLSMQARHAQNIQRNHLSEALAHYDWPLGPVTASVQLSTHHFREVGQYSYADTSWRVQATPTKDWHGCKAIPNTGQVRQRFTGSTQLAGQYTHTGLELQCQNSPRAQTTLSLHAGTDQPAEANRPGGAKRRQEITLKHERLLPLPTLGGRSVHGLLKTWVRQSHSQDQALFSPLLGEANTQTRRRDLGASYWWPLAPQWHMGLDLESTSQKSTNGLLNIKNHSLHLGLRWTSKP